MPSPRSMTPEEREQGYVVRDCGIFAHVWRAGVLKRLPRDYHGELCPECSLWMCSVAMLRSGTENNISK